MRALILGGSGFIGTALSGHLLDKGWQVVIPSRNPEKGRFLIPQGHSLDVSFVMWDGNDALSLAKYCEGADAIINLAGESIAAARWTDDQKRRIRQSRVQTGEVLIKALKELQTLPEVLIQGSAVGYYGGSQTLAGPDAFTEFSPSGQGFLASVARDWEASTLEAERMGIRRAVIRTGVVLGPGEGALQKFISPFSYFAGGPLGTGQQGFSWIHRDDTAGAIAHIIENKDCAGPFNLTAPMPVTMLDFCNTLGRVMNRPSWLPVPGFMLRLMLGEMAEELILQGQFALPGRLVGAGYSFRFNDLENALRDILIE
ncbi:TIGR01777 family oxidoreductase [Desulfovibrio subterraneus]|uniref:TIGR01777 family oxidoreductase n=1 Tax=Desulfovibrio subterraneus TaxID=2718620 RepID=UPI0022B8A9D8|nr:TIGR01777 family oxidoreductase [Desulfovibrio subterraneus]WBF67070.1 TIGR01777 family oxidoreductase [Desulfovibrio subterraneus]